MARAAGVSAVASYGLEAGELTGLRLVVCPIIYKVLYIQGGCLVFLNHQQYVIDGFSIMDVNVFGCLMFVFVLLGGVVAISRKVDYRHAK